MFKEYETYVYETPLSIGHKIYPNRLFSCPFRLAFPNLDYRTILKTSEWTELYLSWVKFAVKLDRMHREVIVFVEAFRERHPGWFCEGGKACDVFEVSKKREI